MCSKAEETVKTWAEVEPSLQKQARLHYPESKFTQSHGGVPDEIKN